MQVTADALPEVSKLWHHKQTGDFLDCFSAPSDRPIREAAEMIAAFPAWARLLVRLRAIVTRPFGLRQEGPKMGDQLGPFPIEFTSEHEIIAGFDDKHLNFRISALNHNGRLHLATWVRCHNFGGRIYLAAIMPFHILIARNAVARAAHVKG